MTQNTNNNIELLRHRIDEYSDHLIITDANSVILYMNPAAEEHTGFSFAEAKGKRPGELWGGHMPKPFYEAMWQTIKKEKRLFVGEVENVRKDGVHYWQALDISPVLNASDEPEFFIAIELKFASEKAVYMINNAGRAGSSVDISIRSFRWILAWLFAHSVISSEEEKELSESMDKDASGADFVAKILAV